jgi:hypothetical protein
MKMISKGAAVGFLLSISFAGVPATKAATPPAPSNLSGFAGKYRGTVLFTGVAPGQTNARIVGARSAERGKITLTSTISAGGTTGFLVETIRLQGTRANYSLQLAGGGTNTLAFGAGTASVTKHVIRYNATVSNGGTTLFLRGTVRKSRSGRMTVLHTLGDGVTSLPISYSLRPQGS